MRGWWLNSGTVVAAAAMVWSCGAHQPGRAKDIQDKLAQTMRAARAVTEGVEAQAVSPEAEAAERTAQTGEALKPGAPIWLQSGKSRVFHLKRPIKRVSVGNPEVAGIVVLGPYTVMVNAKQLPVPKGPEAARYAPLQIGGGRIATSTIIGRTLTPEPHLAETTLVLWDGESEDVHALSVADFLDQQVMLEVTIAEINRTAMEQHGVDVRALQKDFIAASFMGAGGGGTGIIPQVPLLPLTLTPDKPNYAFIFPNEDVSVLLQTLETEGLATVLARPKLLALSGQNAVFQEGGEIPIRISTGLVANVEFKPFGTLVNFVPQISEGGDIVLTVSPEVSEPDFSKLVEGIPTFITRRTSTSTRLRNSETLVVSGLLQTRTQEVVKGVPYFKDIPYLGYIFRFTSYSKENIELLIVVTPRLVHARPPGTDVALPTDRGPLTTEETRTQPDAADATRPRLPGVP
jgi:pilus assembly protein CpaC